MYRQRYCMYVSRNLSSIWKCVHFHCIPVFPACACVRAGYVCVQGQAHGTVCCFSLQKLIVLSHAFAVKQWCAYSLFVFSSLHSFCCLFVLFSVVFTNTTLGFGWRPEASAELLSFGRYSYVALPALSLLSLTLPFACALLWVTPLSLEG